MSGESHRDSKVYQMKAETVINPTIGNGPVGESGLPKRHYFKSESDSRMMTAAKHELSKDISALYGLLALVAGLCTVPLAEVVDNFDADFLRWVETVNLIVAIVFLLFCFAFLFRPPATKYICGPVGEIPESPNLFDICKLRFRRFLRRTSTEDEVCMRVSVGARHLTQQVMDSGSLYLKMGCVIFGVGSLVYCSITLGIFAENHHCFPVTMGINPVLLVLFIGLQLMFIFRNSQFTITKYKAVGRMGLMHIVVLNLLICLRVIVDETVHSFHKITEQEEGQGNEADITTGASVHRSGGIDPAITGTGAYLSECVSDTSIMKWSLKTSTIFLYPCIVEYALISAGIVYTMWRGLGQAIPVMDLRSTFKKSQLRAKSAFSINCDQALGGMFAGLLVVAGVLVGLIIFFIAVSTGDWQDNATLDWMIMDIGLHSLGIGAVIYCSIRFFTQMDRIHVESLNLDLDDSLIMFSMIGVYAYNISSVLAVGQCTGTVDGRMAVTSGVLGLVQATFQTIFLFDGGKRGLKKLLPGDALEDKKPGRQMLTFLLIVNFALWAVNVFCALRIDGSLCETRFYGPRMWALITHTTVPFVIFYRFHSTACIFEIWKRAYREPKDKHLGASRVGSVVTSIS